VQSRRGGPRAAPGAAPRARGNARALPAAIPAPPSLVRTHSAEQRRQRDLQAQGLGIPLLEHQNSNELAERFAKMASWEDSTHPVVLWYESPRTQGEVDGLDFLSLNARYLGTVQTFVRIQNNMIIS
jgi:hypothetical protein